MTRPPGYPKVIVYACLLFPSPAPLLAARNAFTTASLRTLNGSLTITTYDEELGPSFFSPSSFSAPFNRAGTYYPLLQKSSPALLLPPTRNALPSC